MSIKVFAWPPVGVTGADWTEEAPVQMARSMVTGAEFSSAVQRKRRLATLNVSALSRDLWGAGYMEMLKRCLEGIHAVRLNSMPVNWWPDAAAELNLFRQAVPLDWAAADVPLSWTDAAVSLLWFSGTVLFATLTTSGGYPAVQVTGLPPNVLIARPGEFVTSYVTPADRIGSTAQVLAPAYSDAAGVVVIRLLTALAFAGRISIGGSDTAVFKPVAYPRSVQPLAENWFYSWSFREVFADEVGGFEEVDPWPRS